MYQQPAQQYQPQQQFAPQPQMGYPQQFPNQGVVAAPVVVAKKAKGKRSAWEPARFESFCAKLKNSASLIGASFTHPQNPQLVPAQAPDQGEWNGVGNKAMKLAPVYKALYERQKELGSNKGSHNGGLKQKIYIRRSFTQFANSVGVLNGVLPGGVDANGVQLPGTPYQLQIPVLAEAGGIGLGNRSIMTSILVTYVEQNNLKHSNEKKFIVPDQTLINLFGLERIQAQEHRKPKNPKKEKKPKDPTKPRKPKAETHRVKMLDVNGVQTLCFNFDAIPGLCQDYIINMTPLGVTEQHNETIERIRVHLKSLTETRKAATKDRLRVAREGAKQKAVQQSVVPLAVPTLTINPTFQPVGQNGAPQQGFAGFVGAPVSAVNPANIPQIQQQQFAQQPVNNTPVGFATVPGVTFTPQ